MKISAKTAILLMLVVVAGWENSVSPANAKGNNPQYKDISLEDLKLDKEHMIGQKIRTSGLYRMFDGLSLLKGGLVDTNAVTLGIENLSREQRRALLRCAEEDCEIQVEGSVQEEASETGIVVSNIRVLKGPSE